METKYLTDIIIPSNRIRKEFDPQYIDELAKSINDKGLMNAITVRDDGKTLVAGENRLRAITQLHNEYKRVYHNDELLPQGTVPIVRLSKLSPNLIREAELEENTKRRDLTWQERAKAEAELHALRLEQTGGKQTLIATAEEIAGKELPNRGQPVVDLSDSILVSRHMHDPDIAKAPSLKEAKKILTKKLEQKFRQALIDQHGLDPNDKGHTIIHGDAVLTLAGFSPEQFDCIIFDPPYGIGADSFGSQATTTHAYADSPELALRLIELLAPLLWHTSKAQSHLYMFCDPRLFRPFADILQEVGYRIWPTPLIWHKVNSGGMLPEPDYGPRRTYETILFANKGRKPITSVASDVISIPTVTDKEHAAEKPLDLYCDLLRRSTIPGDLILDCCCGSGVVFPAATKLSLTATGIEKDINNFNLAKLRSGADE